MVLYEDILELSGGFGYYQYYLFFWNLLTSISIAPHNGFMVFGKLQPREDEYCHFQNRSWFNESLIQNGTPCRDKVRFYSVTMDFDLMGSKVWIQSFVISLQLAAMLLSSLIVGQISDRFGRKPAFLGSYILLSIVTILSGFAPNWQVFATFRFFIGGLTAACWGPGLIVVLEAVPQSWRLFMDMIKWPFGYMWLGVLGYLTDGWRPLVWAINATVPLSLLASYWVHESPKWLIEKGKIAEARKVFYKIGTWNKVKSWKNGQFDIVAMHLEEFELDQKKAKLEQEDKFLTYWHLFHSWRSGLCIIVITVGRAVCTGVYYGLLFNTGKLSGNVSLNLILTMLIRGIINSLPFVFDKSFPRLGRIHLLEIGLALSALCMGYFFIAYSTSLWHTLPLLVNIAAFGGVGFVSGCNCVFHELCLMETTPTLLRNMGDSFVTAFSRIGAVLGPQILLLFEIWRPAPFLIFFIETVITGILVYFFIPETKGKPLPDLPPRILQRKRRKSSSINKTMTEMALINSIDENGEIES